MAETKKFSPWVQSSVLQRLKQRSLQSESSRRRKTDFVRPVTPEANNEDRRQTLPPRTPAISVPESREIPASPEGSPTLLHDEDIFFDAESLQPRRDGGFAPERSHSPPMRRQRSVPQGTPPPSSEEVWNAAMRAQTPRPLEDTRTKTPAAFVDRQEHAQRVSPISEAPSTNEPPQQPSRKRAFEDDDDDDDDDDEFTRYERAIDPSSKRAQKSDLQHHRVQKRRRIDDNNQPATAPQRGNTPPPGSTRPATPTPPRSTHPATPTPPRPSRADTSSYLDLKIRVRWSEKEDRRLIRLIRECGPHWAALVRQNIAQPVQAGEERIEDRDGVQFKDRARNLKIIYYRYVWTCSFPCIQNSVKNSFMLMLTPKIREGRQNDLPGQFQHVTMSKRDILSLQKRGIEIE